MTGEATEEGETDVSPSDEEKRVPGSEALAQRPVSERSCEHRWFIHFQSATDVHKPRLQYL